MSIFILCERTSFISLLNIFKIPQYLSLWLSELDFGYKRSNWSALRCLQFCGIWSPFLWNSFDFSLLFIQWDTVCALECGCELWDFLYNWYADERCWIYSMEGKVRNSMMWHWNSLNFYFLHPFFYNTLTGRENFVCLNPLSTLGSNKTIYSHLRNILHVIQMYYLKRKKAIQSYQTSAAFVEGSYNPVDWHDLSPLTLIYMKDWVGDKWCLKINFLLKWILPFWC